MTVNDQRVRSKMEKDKRKLLRDIEKLARSYMSRNSFTEEYENKVVGKIMHLLNRSIPTNYSDNLEE